jgi:isoamylase
MPQAPYTTRSGRSLPLGATADGAGVNFSISADDATTVQLLLFERHDDKEPVQTIVLDSATNKTFHFWHVYLEELAAGTQYAYRMDGPKDVHGAGHRYNLNKVLIDPYARANTNTLWDVVAALSPEDNVAASMRSVVVDPAVYDWEGDRPLGRPMNETVIYEMHVRGFTQHPSSKCEAPGTFAGVVERIPYLHALGITAVELLPVFDFDEMEVLRHNPVDDTPLRNYWGYHPFAFFAPQSWYCVSAEVGAHLDEFRDMVKALHRAGIEVILDVVYNHTAEGNEHGPTINFRGIDNPVYYLLSQADHQYYLDFSGTGNSLNCNHPLVQKLIVDSLLFWVREMHVDGFRFDLASVFSRGPDGNPVEYPPVIWAIELSEELAETKVIAEAWDARGLYQVGRFPGARWAEWNGPYRDDIRSFVRGDPGRVGAVASRIAGSSDIFQWSGEQPVNSVNFITCHDGFTLEDLVSYNGKHNEANGEDNRDGNDNNVSWNCGVEGPSDDPGIEGLRQAQIKNFVTLLMLSQGVPMVLAGDEVRRTQRGNNNAYCQDNDVSWLDWDLAAKHAGTLRFFRKMIAFRRNHQCLQRARYFTGEISERGVKDISWHGAKLGAPGWEDPSSQVLAFTLGGLGEDPHDIHVMCNMGGVDVTFEIPPVPERAWHRLIDTVLPAPDDFLDEAETDVVKGSTYDVKPHGIVVLVSQPLLDEPAKPARKGARRGKA